MKEILVIGGSNIDYLSKSQKPLIMGDSNIGTLQISVGGVGRNITENLARLQNKITFLTCLGKDSSGLEIKNQLEMLTVNVLSPDIPYNTGSYVSIEDNNGEMKVAICDTKCMDNFSIKDLQSFGKIIQSHKDIILEANLPQAIIDYLFKKFPSHRYFVESVSANKVGRFRNHLHQIYLFKSNLLEAQQLLNSTDNIHILCQKLLDFGCQKVIISNGKEPIVYGENNIVKECPIVPCFKIVSTNGAGDALFAGIVHSICEGKNTFESIRFGSHMAAETMLVEQAVHPKIFGLTRELKIL